MSSDTDILNYHVDQLCKHYGTKLTIQDEQNSSSKYEIILIPYQATTKVVDHGEVGEAIIVNSKVFNNIKNKHRTAIPMTRNSSLRSLHKNKYLKYKQKYLDLKKKLNL